MAEGVQSLGQAAIEDGPEGAGVAKTLVPVRDFGTPNRVYIKTIEETFPVSGSFPHSIHVYKPDWASNLIYFNLAAKTPGGFIENSHGFSALSLTTHPGEADQSQVTLPNAMGQQLYSVTETKTGWLRIDFTYNAALANRKLVFMAYDETGSALKTYWNDPPGVQNLQVALKVMAEATSPMFLKGGAYRNAIPSQFAYVDDVKINGYSAYRRGFDQGRFNFPLGNVLAGEHNIEFSLKASGSAKYWFSVNDESFDPANTKQTWAASQVLYDGTTHTGDYDAWSDGVAFAQGPSLSAGVRPPPVRRGTNFNVAFEHTALAGAGNALIRIYPFGSGAETNWATTLTHDYAGGLYIAGSFAPKNREHWRVSVPATAAIGRYVLRAFAPGGPQIGQDVMFYVLHDPYAHVTSGKVSKAELETFGYDEDDDGAWLQAPYGTDADNFRDNFTANYSTGPAPYTQRTKLTGAFRRTLEDTPYSILDYAMIAGQGTTSEFETLRRYYRLLVQRMNYSRMDIADDSSRVLMVYGGELSFAQAAAIAVPGSALPAENKSGGECFDYATTLAALARSGGVLARSVSTTGALGGWGLHVLTEAFLPNLPQHGGKRSSSSALNSDVDPWYVFDATDPSGDFPPPGAWQVYTEAIAPRSQYGRAARALFPDADALQSLAITNGVSWDPLADGPVDAAAVQDVSSAYLNGHEFWITQSGVTGWLGFGEKDVYRINRTTGGPRAVRVRTLPSGGGALVPKLCVGTTANDPVMPARCTNAATRQDLPMGASYVVVFNDSAEQPAYHGDSVQYILELE